MYDRPYAGSAGGRIDPDALRVVNDGYLLNLLLVGFAVGVISTIVSLLVWRVILRVFR